MDKKSLKKRIEQFKRTQSINKIVQKGTIEDQALMDSAGDDRPAEEMHALELITQEEGPIPESLPVGHAMKMSAKKRKAQGKISHIIKKLRSSSKKVHRKR
ncbi:MAG: hypothetical protein ACP5RF_02240 [Candidatus Micrarchaeia archaeon]